MTIEEIEQFWTSHEGYFVRHTTVAEYTILAVAVVELYTKSWTVYMKGVPGQNHDLEWMEVRKHGSSPTQEMAQLIFPDMPTELRYTNDI